MKEIKMTMETQPKVLNMTMETGKGGGGVTSYNALTDKPSINGQTLVGDFVLEIPDKTSDLTNDSGFITNSDIPAIPSKVSDLENDMNYVTEDDIPTVPTKVSELENDSNFVTEDAIPTKVSQLENDAQYVKAEDIPEGATISTDEGNTLKKGTDNGLFVPPTDLSGYAKQSDIPFVPEDVSAFNNDAGYITESAVPKKVSELANDSGFVTSADIPDVSIYALTTEAGYDLGLSMDSKTYEMTIELKNKAGTVISTKKLDFPIESMVVNASYKDGKLTLTLQSGSTINVDISAIVGGLVNDTFTIAGIDMKDDITANELKTALGVVDAYTKTETDNLLNGKADSSDIPDISGKADTSYVNTELSKKVDKVTGKGLSTNDFTNTYKSAIDNLPSSYAPTNAEKNVIVGIQKNGTDLTVDANRKVNITVPTKLSDLTADATHRLVTDTEKSTWNGKQSALNTTQMSAVNSGVTTTKVESYDKAVEDVATLNTNLSQLSDEVDELDGEVTEIKSNLSKFTATGRTLELDTEVGGIIVNEIVGNSEQGENPSPSNPQPIHSSGDDGGITIDEVGKNLLVPFTNATYQNVQTIPVNGMAMFNGVASGAGSSYFYAIRFHSIPVSVGEKYILSLRVIDGSAKLASNTIFYMTYYENAQGTNGIRVGQFNMKTSTAKDDVYTLSFEITEDMVKDGVMYFDFAIYKRANDTFNNLLCAVQLEKNDTITDFEPYTNKSIFIPLTEPLRSVGDYRDRIIKKDGKWCVERNIGSYTIDVADFRHDANHKWLIYNTFAQAKNVKLPKDNATPMDSISNRFVSVGVGSMQVTSSYDTLTAYALAPATGNFIIRNTDCTTFQEYTDFFTNNQTDIIYQLATPVYEEITDQTALYLLESYADKTYISTSDGLAELNVNYGKSDAISLGLMGYNAFRLAENQLA